MELRIFTTSRARDAHVEPRPAPSRYLTDGRRLLRVVPEGGGAAPEGSLRLEDCLTLEIRTYTPGELDTMPLRAVASGDEARRTHDETPSSPSASDEERI